MSVVDFNYHELDKLIDERIEQFCMVSNNYYGAVDKNTARLVSSDVFDLQDNQLLSIIQCQQDQITELRETVDTLSNIVHYLSELQKITGTKLELR